MLRRGKQVHSKTKTVVCNIYNYFGEMSVKGGTAIGPVNRMVKATALSQSMVKRIVRVRRRLAEGEQFPTPTKHYCAGSWKCNITDEFDREAFRRRNLYLYQQKVNITLCKLVVRNTKSTCVAKFYVALVPFASLYIQITFREYIYKHNTLWCTGMPFYANRSVFICYLNKKTFISTHTSNHNYF